MNDELIEVMAMAFYEASHRRAFERALPDVQVEYKNNAQAALAAIANSGTHAVIPVKPTTTMTAEGWPPEYFTGDYKAVLRCYKALLAAALAGSSEK